MSDTEPHYDLVAVAAHRLMNMTERDRRNPIELAQLRADAQMLADTITRLQKRLEVVPQFGEQGDGISCRDDTIALLEERITRLQSQLDAAREELNLVGRVEQRVDETKRAVKEKRDSIQRGARRSLKRFKP